MSENDQENLKDRIELLKILLKEARGYSDVLTIIKTAKKVEILMSFNISPEQWETAMDKHLAKIAKKKTVPQCEALEFNEDGKIKGAGKSDDPFPGEEKPKKKHPVRIGL